MELGFKRLTNNLRFICIFALSCAGESGDSSPIAAVRSWRVASFRVLRSPTPTLISRSSRSKRIPHARRGAPHSPLLICAGAR
jgi:hypothetical protein